MLVFIFLIQKLNLGDFIKFIKNLSLINYYIVNEINTFSLKILKFLIIIPKRIIEIKFSKKKTNFFFFVLTKIKNYFDFFNNVI